MYIDSHCHLTTSDVDNIEEIIDKLDNNLAITSGYSLASNKEIPELCNKYKNIYGTLGIHPSEIDDNIEEALSFIEENINKDKIIAIGEIGLDYHYEGDYNLQKEVFIRQLDLARKYNKPVVIHSRDAFLDTYQILKDYSDLKIVIHCFSYSLESAKLFVNIGCSLGIGGVLTFKNNRVLKEVVENINIKNLLLETDAPWLTPEPFRGSKNIPSNVIYVAEKIAEIKQISLEEVVKETTNNTIKQFDLNILI